MSSFLRILSSSLCVNILLSFLSVSFTMVLTRNIPRKEPMAVRSLQGPGQVLSQPWFITTLPQFSSLCFNLVLHLCIFLRWMVTRLMVWFPALHPSSPSLPTPTVHHSRTPDPGGVYTFCIPGKGNLNRTTSISLGFIF